MAQNLKTLTIEETIKLIEYSKLNKYTVASKYKSLRNCCMILCMVDAGMRVGEVVNARISWFMFDNKILSSVNIPAEFTKTKTERIVPLSIRLNSAMQLMSNFWQESNSDHELAICFRQSRTGSSLSTRQVQRIIGNLGHTAIGRHVHPHMLRHTFGTRLMRTTNASVVQKLLGHKHLSSTQIYCHPDQEDLKNAIGNMDKVNDEKKA